MHTIEVHVAHYARLFCKASVYKLLCALFLATSCLLYADTVPLRNEQCKMSEQSELIDTRHMRTRVITIVCVSVCNQSTDFLRCLYNKI